MTALNDRSAGSGPVPSDHEVWILIVDDEPGCRETLGDIFRERGYHTETAATGRQALENAKGRFFNVAILDVRLPDMNGTELLTRLKEEQPDTVAVMVTGYASLQTCVRAIQAGASSYLLKPLDFDHLFNVVEEALDRQRSVWESRRLLSQYRERIGELEAREAQLTERVQRLEQEVAGLRGPAS
jgi:DNA-binding NtrC family response regulator